MVRPGRELLSGTVEVDEIYVGGPEKGKRAGKLGPRPLSRWRRMVVATAASAFGHDYLDEFTFRFNRRGSQVRGVLFHKLARQAGAVEPAPYHRIVAAGDPTPEMGGT